MKCHADENHCRQKDDLLNYFPVADTDSVVLRINFRCRCSSHALVNYFPVQLQIPGFGESFSDFCFSKTVVQVFDYGYKFPVVQIFFLTTDTDCLYFRVLLVWHSTHAVFARISDHGRRTSNFPTPPSCRSKAAAALQASLHGCTARNRSRQIFPTSFHVAFCDTHCEEQGRHGRWRSPGPTVAQRL